MIEQVGTKGYRAFGEETTVPLRQLTVVFGKNNSGKTTLTRLPLFIAASITQDRCYALTDKNLRFGGGFRDLGTHDNPHPSITYWVDDSDTGRWLVQLQMVAHALNEDVRLGRVVADDIDLTIPIKGSEIRRLSDLDASQQGMVLPVRGRVAQSLSGTLHIPSARPDVRPIYEVRAPQAHTVNEAPYLLLSHEDLVEAVTAWLTEMFGGMRLEVERNDYAFRLVSGPTSSPVNFASTGRGSQALLPVVVLLKAVMLGLVTAPLVIVEEPEAHLHPSAHAAVAELLAEASAHTQVVTETHSENFILRLRRKVAVEQLRQESLGLIYVDEHSRVIPIEVDRFGGVPEWPDGVFAYDIEEARAIVQARLQALGEK